MDKVWVIKLLISRKYYPTGQFQSVFDFLLLKNFHQKIT